MKRAYSKPVVFFENFELDAAITMTCVKVEADMSLIDAYLSSFADISGMSDAEKEALADNVGLGDFLGTDDANSKECYFTHSNPSFVS